MPARKKIYSQAVAYGVAYLSIMYGSLRKAAKEIGISPSTIASWKRSKPEFLKILKNVSQMLAHRKEQVIEETAIIVHVNEIIQMYINAGLKGNVTAIDRLAFIFGNRIMKEATGKRITMDVTLTANLSGKQLEAQIMKRAMEINPELRDYLSNHKEIAYEDVGNEIDEHGEQ